jgi:hypothetical protein
MRSAAGQSLSARACARWAIIACTSASSAVVVFVSDPVPRHSGGRVDPSTPVIARTSTSARGPRRRRRGPGRRCRAVSSRRERLRHAEVVVHRRANAAGSVAAGVFVRPCRARP